MRVVLNIIWLLLSGIWLFICYLLAAILSFIFIITIPFGVASLRIAFYALWPFGKTTIVKESAGAASCVGNVIWLVVAGWWLVLGHIISGIALCITIIGIPFGIANFKMVPLSLMPLGRQIVDTDDPRAFGI